MRVSILTKTLLVSLGLTVVLAVVTVISLVVGTSYIDLKKMLFDGMGGAEFRKVWTILVGYRLPRTLLAALAGGGLASAGVIFQGVLRNPLADPYLIGIASGGALGAVTSIVFFGEAWVLSTSASAFLGSLVAVGLVYGLATMKRDAGYTNTVILAGVIVAALMNALMLLIISVSGSDEMQRILLWLMGDLSLANYSKITMAAVFVSVGWVALYMRASHLNLLLAGEEAAANLGLNVPLARTFFISTAALITGAIVSVAGTIGFVGLVVPHAMRLLFGPDHRVLLPAALIGGAAFLAAADCVARVAAYPVELPVGVITALTGAPFFLYLLVRK
jgi:iron complex transport system permease protein